MTGTSSVSGEGMRRANPERARQGFARLMTYVANLYCTGESSSISSFEVRQLAESIAYVLGIIHATANEVTRVLDVDDPIALWHAGLDALDTRMDAALDVRRDIIALMPTIRNVALRDTLASLGELKKRYDTRFTAHEVPCDIDYQLSNPVDPALMGIDYIEAYLAQLLEETRWIAQFDVKSCIAVLERVCPDHRGLHVNLYDLLAPHEDELQDRTK